MSKFIQGIVLQDKLAEHPAVQAWHKLGVADSTPTRVEILKERKKKKFENKSAVYRLSGFGDDHLSIVAKRCERKIAEVERCVYDYVLPQLPLETLSFYGTVGDADDNYCWLFIEDADGEPFSENHPSHGLAAAKWLAKMHASSSKSAVLSCLPARDTSHYFEQLEVAQQRIATCLEHSSIELEEKKVLRRLLIYLDHLTSIWDGVAAMCDQLPRSLVHGDFAAKNLCVRQRAAELKLVPFDWEMAGFGTVAADLFSLSSDEIAVYQSILGQSYPELVNVEFDRVVVAGKFLRFTNRINWSAMSLVEGCTQKWVARPMCQLRVYADRLESLLSSQLQSKSCTHE